MSLSNQDLESTNARAKSTWKDFVVGVSGLLFYLVAFVGIIFLLMFLIRGGTWVAVNIYPTASLVLATFVLIAIPISLVLAIFKKSRGIASTGLLISSYALGLNLWLSSLIMAYTFAGTFWLIVGLLFGGIGVVPIAFIATLISGEWSIAGQIFLMTAIVYGVRALSTYLSKHADYKNEIVDEEFEKEFDAFWEEHQRISEIVEGFGRFLEKEKPLIPDIDWLPYPKDEINDALIAKEQELCDIANECVKTGRTEKLPELEKGINALGACRMFLQSYTEIAPEDQDDVDYFNDYQSIDEVPEEERTQCSLLLVKYMTASLE